VAINRTTLTETERARLATLAAGQPDVATAARLGVHRSTLDRLLAGRPCNPGTVVAARMVLALVTKAQEPRT
jgi:hypothetical protein